jgi:hypothetical protein
VGLEDEDLGFDEMENEDGFEFWEYVRDWDWWNVWSLQDDGALYTDPR